MKKIILVLTISLLSLYTFAQTTPTTPASTDSVTFKRGYFLQNGKKLNRIKITGIMMNTPEAYKHLKASFADANVATFFATLGGGLIGWPLGTALAGGKPLWALAGVGVGMALISIPIYASANKKAAQAAKIYNQRLGTNQITGMRLRLHFSGNGIGLRLKF
ncbi:hypothetical protein [uncultured Microscilla sp.]|uniref:hypothetical protein n=1 Tax=uncultured Microscilla sp. TaxID=432653 RepID=UPI0026266E30|nr:hypothetical protein [uncultured Microscilla sp.]